MLALPQSPLTKPKATWMLRAPKVSAPSQTMVAPTLEHRRQCLWVQALKARASPELKTAPRGQVQDLIMRRGQRSPKDRVTADLTEVPILTELEQSPMLREVWAPQVRMTAQLKRALCTMVPVLTR